MKEIFGWEGFGDALLREIEKDPKGYSCEFMKDALKLFTMDEIEKKLAEARARREAQAKKTYQGGRRHYEEELDDKKEEIKFDKA